MAKHTVDLVGRSFRATMATTLVSLLVVCVALSAALFLKGPELDEALVDTTAITTAPAQQVRLFSNQAVSEVDPSQVSVTPAADFSVTTADDTIAIQFTHPLHYDTDYAIKIHEVTSAYSDRASTFDYRFSTASGGLHYLDRAGPADGGDQLDAIVFAPVGGAGREIVYEAPAIQDFVVSGDILVVATLDQNTTSSLTLVDARDGTREVVRLPGAGTIDLLRANAAGIVGFAFASAAGVTPELANVLHTFDLNADHLPQPVAGLDGAPLSASNWYLIGNTARAFVQSVDKSTSVVDLTGATIPSPRGQFDELLSISPDGSRVLAANLSGLTALRIEDGSQQPIAPSLVDGVTPFVGQATLLGDTSAHISQVAVLDGASAGFASYVIYDDGSSTRVLYQNPGSKGSIGRFSVSPNGQFVAVEATPASSGFHRDGYLVNGQPTAITTMIVDIASGTLIRSLDGFAPAW